MVLKLAQPELPGVWHLVWWQVPQCCTRQIAALNKMCLWSSSNMFWDWLCQKKSNYLFAFCCVRKNQTIFLLLLFFSPVQPCSKQHAKLQLKLQKWMLFLCMPYFVKDGHCFCADIADAHRAWWQSQTLCGWGGETACQGYVPQLPTCSLPA